MKTSMLQGGLAALVVMIYCGAASAGPISQACNQSSRAASTPSLCACIQSVANQTLRASDQRRVAGFFKDPDKAQSVFLSQKGSDDAFWERYERFGAAAEAMCQAG